MTTRPHAHRGISHSHAPDHEEHVHFDDNPLELDSRALELDSGALDRVALELREWAAEAPAPRPVIETSTEIVLPVRVTTTDGEGADTVAVASVLDGPDKDLVGHGRARLRPEDYYVAKIGEGIAIGNALRDLGAQVADRWASRSATRDEVEERRNRA